MGQRKYDNIRLQGQEEQAEKFKKYAADNGKTANALLKDFVLEKIEERE